MARRLLDTAKIAMQLVRWMDLEDNISDDEDNVKIEVSYSVTKHHLKVVMMLQMRIWMNRIAKTSASPEVELGGGLAASGLS